MAKRAKKKKAVRARKKKAAPGRKKAGKKKAVRAKKKTTRKAAPRRAAPKRARPKPRPARRVARTPATALGTPPAPTVVETSEMETALFFDTDEESDPIELP